MTPTEQDKELRDKVATIVEYWDFSPLQDEDSRIERLKNEIMQLITAYTNKQIEMVLDRLEARGQIVDTRLFKREIVATPHSAIEAERNNLNLSKSTPYRTLEQIAKETCGWEQTCQID